MYGLDLGTAKNMGFHEVLSYAIANWHFFALYLSRYELPTLDG